MKLTDEEKEVCNEYSFRGLDGKVHCSECPLAIDIRGCACKANVSKEEWEEYQE